MLSDRPPEELQFGTDSGFARLPRFPSLRKLALDMGPDAVGAIYTDASSGHGRGAVIGDRFFQGKWPKLELREGINWKVLWALKTALETRGEFLVGKLVLVRMDNSAAVSCANYGAGGAPHFTQLWRALWRTA